MLLLIRLVLVLVEATTSLTSTPTSLATSSSSVVEFVVSSACVHVVMLIVANHLIRIGPLLHFVLNEMNEFLHLVDVLLFVFVNQVELGLPELDLEGSVSVSEWAGLVEQLDALLGLSNFFIADVTNLAGQLGGSNGVSLLELQGDDLSGLVELASEFFFTDLLGDVSDENVGLESLLQVCPMVLSF